MQSQTTGIGSVPFSDLQEAWSYIKKSYDLPFQPQIARGQGDGGMLNLVLPPELGRRELSGFGVALTDLLESGAIHDAFRPLERVRETVAFQDASELCQIIEDTFKGPFKTQLIGPVSLLATLRDAASRPLWSDDSLHPIVMSWITELATSLFRLFNETGIETEVWIDEPMLGLIQVAVERKKACAVIREWQDSMATLGIKTGIHCCSQPPFDFVSELRPCTLSFDLVRYGKEATENKAILQDFVERGGTLGFGVMAPMAFTPDEDPRPQIRALLAKEDESNANARMFLTPTCGTMLTPVDREEEISGQLEEWSKQWNASETD